MHIILIGATAQAQILLLAGGYVHRIMPMKLVILMRSRAYLRTISNRLAASQQRAKFLGMVVGEALSGLPDASNKKLNFHMYELDSDEAVWYKGLVNISDAPGPFDVLRSEAVKASIADHPSSGRAARPSKTAKILTPASRKHPVH